MTTIPYFEFLSPSGTYTLQVLNSSTHFNTNLCAILRTTSGTALPQPLNPITDLYVSGIPSPITDYFVGSYLTDYSFILNNSVLNSTLGVGPVSVVRLLSDLTINLSGQNVGNANNQLIVSSGHLFDGNNNTITLTNSGSAYIFNGLLRQRGGTINNLSLDIPISNNVPSGVILNQNHGWLLQGGATGSPEYGSLTNCHVFSSNPPLYILENESGGITGRYYGGTNNSIINSCTVTARFDGINNTVGFYNGGICGRYANNDNNNKLLFINNCTVNAIVQGQNNFGGICGPDACWSNNNTLDIQNCTVNITEIGSNTDCAGFVAGNIEATDQYAIKLTNCSLISTSPSTGLMDFNGLLGSGLKANIDVRKCVINTNFNSNEKNLGILAGPNLYNSILSSKLCTFTNNIFNGTSNIGLIGNNPFNENTRSMTFTLENMGIIDNISAPLLTSTLTLKSNLDININGLNYEGNPNVNLVNTLSLTANPDINILNVLGTNNYNLFSIINGTATNYSNVNINNIMMENNSQILAQISNKETIVDYSSTPFEKNDPSVSVLNYKTLYLSNDKLWYLSKQNNSYSISESNLRIIYDNLFTPTLLGPIDNYYAITLYNDNLYVYNSSGIIGYLNLLTNTSTNITVSTGVSSFNNIFYNEVTNNICFINGSDYYIFSVISNSLVTSGTINTALQEYGIYLNSSNQVEFILYNDNSNISMMNFRQFGPLLLFFPQNTNGNVLFNYILNGEPQGLNNIVLPAQDNNQQLNYVMRNYINNQERIMNVDCSTDLDNCAVYVANSGILPNTIKKIQFYVDSNENIIVNSIKFIYLPFNLPTEQIAGNTSQVIGFSSDTVKVFDQYKKYIICGSKSSPTIDNPNVVPNL